MEQVERITRMEQILDRAETAVEALSQALAQMTETEGELPELEAYYESPEWMHDFEADSAGELPRELKRGVLSEDGVYNVLALRDQLLEDLHTFLKERRHD